MLGDPSFSIWQFPGRKGTTMKNGEVLIGGPGGLAQFPLPLSSPRLQLSGKSLCATSFKILDESSAPRSLITDIDPFFHGLSLLITDSLQIPVHPISEIDVTH